MDELIKKLIDNKDNLISCRLNPSRGVFGEKGKAPFQNFLQYGGMVGLSRSFYSFFSYNVNVVLWPQDGIYRPANSIYPLQNKNYDALSYSFAGCSMVRFSLNNKWYIAHIQSSTNLDDDRRKDWIDFFNCNKSYINIEAMFRPDIEDCDMQDVSKNTGLWGLITKELKCYSLYVQHFDAKDNLQRMYDDRNTQKIKLIKIKQHDMNDTSNHAQFLDVNNWNDWSNKFAQYIGDWNRHFTGKTQIDWDGRQ